MRYLYCTVAIGDDYVNSAINIAKRLNEKSTNHHMLIATNKEYEEVDNLTYAMLPEDAVLFTTNSAIFNYNLKYFPLYLSSQMDYDYVIFIDSDWVVRDEYNEEGIIKTFEFMEEHNLDVLFERPHKIGGGKHDGNNCFWKHKRDFYKLLETDEYDEGHVCNEQFLVFRNNEKFNIFVNKWRELALMASKANLWGYAEGVEMGMSMATAKMTFSFYGWWRWIPKMFEFKAKNGQTYIRY